MGKVDKKTAILGQSKTGFSDSLSDPQFIKKMLFEKFSV
jgi:hypothetical protein